MSIRELLIKNKKHFSYYMIGALLTTTLNIMFTFALSYAFGMIEATTREAIIHTIMIVTALVMAPIVIQILSRYLRIGFMRDILIQVRTMTYDKVMGLPIETFRKQSREHYLSLMVSDINLFEKNFFVSLLNIIASFGGFILGEIILFVINPWIALLTFAVSIVLFIITKGFEKPVKQSRKAIQQANGQYNEQISNVLNGVEIIKLYHVEENFKNPFKIIVSRLEAVKERAIWLVDTQNDVSMWISATFQVLVYAYATYLYTQGEIPLEQMVILFNLVGQQVFSIVSGFNFVNQFKSSIEIYDRLTKTDLQIEHYEAASCEKGLAVENLTFSYGTRDVLHNVSFTIEPHEKVLIYGPSGTGKTTLLNCLSQTLTTYGGKIMLGDAELKSIRHESFLEACGYIRQQHFMFEESIRNNIILDQDYDAKKLEKVLRDVDLWEWVQQLPQQDATVLAQNGTNISGGQRQRISIARELYRDCNILFIDEPSASLDDQTALKIYDTLLKLDKTMICVSHRHFDYLAQHFNKVIQLEEGGNVLETA